MAWEVVCSPAFGIGEPPIRNFVSNPVLGLVGKRIPKSFRRAARSRHGSTVLVQRFSVFQNDQVLALNLPFHACQKVRAASFILSRARSVAAECHQVMRPSISGCR
jgi:hypothetical protein